MFFERCQRCYCEAESTIMSRFNTDMICSACSVKEKKHPKYKEAEEAEIAAVKRGDTNFPGIGKPHDL